MFVIRKKLAATDITPGNLRWNDDCSCVQQTFDGGDTWVDAPGQDPRSSNAFRAPALSTSDPRCDAAANMLAKLHAAVDTAIAFDNSVRLAGEMFALFALAMPALGIVVAVFTIIADVLLAIGAAAIDGAFTSDVYDQLLCVFYDHIDADGQMSDSQLDDIYTEVAANFDVVVQAVFGAVSSGAGAVGWSNVGALGTETGDCGACAGWTWCWLGGDGLGDWETPVSALGKTAGVYNSGLDTIDGTIINPENNVWANFYLGNALHIKQVRLVFDNVNSGGSGSTDSSYNCQTNLTTDSFGYSDPGMTDNEHTFTLNEDVEWIQFVMTAQVSMSVKRIEMQGTGETPTSGVDCTP